MSESELLSTPQPVMVYKRLTLLVIGFRFSIDEAIWIEEWKGSCVVTIAWVT